MNLPSIDIGTNYWLAGNKPDLVFKAVAAAWVPPTDGDYAAWLAANHAPSRIACDGELADVLLKGGASNGLVAACGATAFGALSPDAIAAVLLAIGVTVTSTATPGLDGTYAADSSAQQDIAAEAQYVKTFDAYSGGQTTLAWADVMGQPHAFPADIATTGTFMLFARAVADYRTQVSLATAALAARGVFNRPSAVVTLP